LSEDTGQIKSFRDLRVWRSAMDLAVGVYEATKAFPRHEVYGLASQLQRAAVSVPSNIAEGHTRDHSREYLQHVSIAQATLAEVETQIEIAVRLRYLPSDRAQSLLDQAAAIGRQLYALRNALRRKA
jgi:four helix bundle protein